MNTNDAARDTALKLYGPTVQYADGKVVPGQAIDVERVLTQFEHLEADARSAFLCIIGKFAAKRCLIVFATKPTRALQSC